MNVFITQALALILAVSVALVFSGCAATPAGEKRPVLQFQQDVFVSDGRINREPRKRFETFELVDQPVLVEAAGFTSVFVVPPPSTVGAIDVKLKPLDDFGGEKPAEPLDVSLNELLTGIQEVYLLMAFNRLDEATAKTDLLLAIHPRLVHLKLLKASCLVLRNDRGTARALLESALVDYPNHKQAQQLLQSLSSTESPRAPGENAQQAVERPPVVEWVTDDAEKSRKLATPASGGKAEGKKRP